MEGSVESRSWSSMIPFFVFIAFDGGIKLVMCRMCHSNRTRRLMNKKKKEGNFKCDRNSSSRNMSSKWYYC